jgi:endonuclease/exonuclease/phosphatase family metal-dependent hydrolase
MPTLTAATINLRNRQDRWLERRHLLISELIDIQPDLISLQEISLPINQGYWLRNQINLRLTGDAKRPYTLIQRRKAHLIYGQQEAIGILSRLPVLYYDSINLGYGGRVALRANIELPNRNVLDFVAVHLHHIAHDKEAREEQAMKLTGWLATNRYVPLQIVAGDFNETPDGPAIQKMKQGFRSAYAEFCGHEPLATFPTPLIGPAETAVCLDYIFLSPGIGKVTDARLFLDKPNENDDTLYPSDHVGILVQIDIDD